MDNSLLCVRARILSCLEIILGLEDRLSTLPQAGIFLREVTVLKKTTRILRQLDVQEEDAERIEKATSQLLKELELPLALESFPPAVSSYPQ